MPTQTSQQPPWARNLAPLFRGSYSDAHLRVSDADRQAVADRLADHFSCGRLDQPEFDERLGRAMSAKTRGDLSGLFADLPETGAPAVPDQPRRHGRPFMIIAAVILTLAAAQAVLHSPVAWLWVFFFGAIMVFASRSRRSRPREEESR